MELIIRDRQAGKTTELINISYSTKGVIICANNSSRRHILTMAKDMHKEVPEPITYQEFIQGDTALELGGILIDDCEHFLAYITKHKILAVSFSATTKTRG